MQKILHQKTTILMHQTRHLLKKLMLAANIKSKSLPSVTSLKLLKTSFLALPSTSSDSLRLRPNKPKRCSSSLLTRPNSSRRDSCSRKNTKKTIVSKRNKWRKESRPLRHSWEDTQWQTTSHSKSLSTTHRVRSQLWLLKPVIKKSKLMIILLANNFLAKRRKERD